MKKLLLFLVLSASFAQAHAAKRFYIAPVTGVGTRQNPYRVNISSGADYSAVINSDNFGVPTSTWCLVVIYGSTQTAYTSDPKLTAIPNVSLDTLMSALTTPQRNAIKNKMNSLSVPASVYNNAVTVRDIIRGIGQFLYPYFDERNFDRERDQ